jgi:hypothetical protein
MRALRRHHLERMKERAKAVFRSWGRFGRSMADDPTAVGIAAGVHTRWCSCFKCRHGKDVPPRRERSALAEPLNNEVN